MALLGLISLAQIWLIPGYAFIYQARDISRWDKILLAVPLSAVINFYLVYSLVLLGLYTQQVVIAIFLLEISLLIFFAWRKARSFAQKTPATPAKIGFETDSTNIVFALMSLLVIAQVFGQIGTVFTQGDAVSSWNNWAISWFNGIIPLNIAWYPQLLPTLYSLTYQFIADSRIELFAKIAESFYPLVTLGIFVRMATIFPAERKRILWAAIILFLLVRRLWGGESAVNGYADFPLAFFSLSILYVFALKASAQLHNKDSSSSSYVIILIAVSIGAGLMKQSGVFLGMFVPFVWLAYFRNGKSLRGHVVQSASIGIAIALSCAAWYLYQYWRISTGVETSNLKMLSGIIHLSWYESIIYGFKSITYKLSWLWVLLILASLAHRKIRYVTFFVVTPFFLLWAAFVPYDYRNLAPIFPLLAVSLSYGWGELTHVATRALPNRINARLIQRSVVVIVLGALAIALANPQLNNELLKLSDNAKSQIGDPEINSRLTAYFEFHPEPSLVATPYNELKRLPDIGKRFSPFSCGGYYEFGGHIATLETILSELSDPAIRQVLLLPWCDPIVLEYFASQPDKYHAVFRHNDAVLYEIRARL